jgi:hypothetical protein
MARQTQALLVTAQLLLKFDFTLEINGSEETGRSGMRQKKYRLPVGDKAHAVEA